MAKAKATSNTATAAKAATVTVKAVKEKTSGPKELITYGTGRRKNAVARVYLKRGSGKIIVNDKALEVYFARPVLRMIINQPFGAIDRIGNFDITCNVFGGGLSGQAGAIRHGLDGGGAGIPRCRRDDGDALAARGQHMIEQAANQLHRHVFKGQSRAVEQFLRPECGVELHQGHHGG